MFVREKKCERWGSLKGIVTNEYRVKQKGLFLKEGCVDWVCQVEYRDVSGNLSDVSGIDSV